MFSRTIMKTITMLFFAITCIVLVSCGLQSNDHNKINKKILMSQQEHSEDNPRFSKKYDSSKVEHYYPFVIYKDGSYMIAAEIEHPDLFHKYQPIFEKYGYAGGGYNWAGLITQILQKEQPALLNHVTFDPEAGGFYVFADNEKNQKLFAEAVSAIFSDINVLKGYLKTANKNAIENYGF
jgi:hypothetical protein